MLFVSFFNILVFDIFKITLNIYVGTYLLNKNISYYIYLIPELDLDYFI